MSKSNEHHNSYVNEHEINDWLVRNNYPQTMQNRQVLQHLANRLHAEQAHRHTSWSSLDEIDNHHKQHGIPELEKDH